MIGTIGVATAEETITTLTPHDHGGNLDTTDMTGGTTATSPSFNRSDSRRFGRFRTFSPTERCPKKTPSAGPKSLPRFQ